MRHLLAAALLWAAPAWAQDAEDAEDDASGEQPEAAAAEDAELEALKARLAALEDQVQAQSDALADQQADLDDQASDLDKQRKDLTAQRLKTAKGKDLTLDVEGYYRARFHVFGTGRPPVDSDKKVGGRLFDDQPTTGQYLNQRVRLTFRAKYRDTASFNVQVQALDNVIWGDNASLARTALFAGNPSYTDITGQEVAPFQVLRAWTEFKIPVGQFRVGRMASHWGLGILVNDGDGFRNDLGEAYNANQFDRILFATNLGAIAKAVSKKDIEEVPIFLAIAYDKLVTDPLVQYYGYRCKDGVDQSVDPEDYDARCDADGNGITDLDHSWTEDRDADQRRGAWWTDSRDDVNEMIYSVFFRKKGMKLFGGYGDLFAGFYAIHRWQGSTDSEVVILDGAVDAKISGVILQFEGLGILGTTRAITLPSSENPDDPIFKRANIASYALRVGYERDWFKVLMESGFASGDENVTDPLFTGRAMNPDYNVGLLLYEEVLDRLTRDKWVGDASSLRSDGGVYNSHYLYPRVSFFPANNLEILLAGVVAFPHQADGAVILCNEREAAGGNCSPNEGLSDILGWELDLAIKHTFQNHINVSFETGYAKATNRLPLSSVGLNADGNFWTFQGRVAWIF